MSTTAGIVLTDLLDRVRSVDATLLSNQTPPTTADGQAFGFSLISTAQTLVNLGERLATKTVTFTPTANQVLYLLSSIIPDAITIEAVRVAGVKELDGPCDFMGFARNSFTWLIDTSTQFLAWSQIGKDIFVVVPAFASAPATLTIRYLQNLPPVALVGDLMTVPDDTVEHVTRLAELIARIKTRQLRGFQDRLQTLAQAMQIEVQANPDTGPRGH